MKRIRYLDGIKKMKTPPSLSSTNAQPIKPAQEYPFPEQELNLPPSIKGNPLVVRAGELLSLKTEKVIDFTKEDEQKGRLIEISYLIMQLGELLTKEDIIKRLEQELKIDTKRATDGFWALRWEEVIQFNAGRQNLYSRHY